MHLVISSVPIFACADVEATLAYYKEVLGFESTWTWGDPPSFGGASCGGVSVMFNTQPDVASGVRGHQHWIKVEDADASYALHSERGATIVSEIENKPWGGREYVLEDLNGYHLRFSGPPANEVKRSEPLPEGLVLERRTPTSDEYGVVAGAAFGYKCATDLLEYSWGGVVAMLEGKTVGVLRIMHDAPGWFSIWDVAVLPEWQSKRVGSELMKEAVELIREASPGAIVYLFTYKHGFYERLGFAMETVSMRRL